VLREFFLTQAKNGGHGVHGKGVVKLVEEE